MKVRTATGLAVAATLALAAPAASAASKPSAPTGKTVMTLPAPSGKEQVGTVRMRLVDRSRHDPWVPSQAYRELMVSVFYPARDAGKYPVAPEMSAKAAAHFDESLATPIHQGLGIPAGKADWSKTLTHSHQGAPAEPGKHPVILYSPGLGDPRTLGTTLAEDLASKGYVVVTIDHTYDASEVEFPGGRVEPFRLPMGGDVLALLKKVVATRVADTRFVLGSLGGLPVKIDPRRVGMFGQSAGGFTALETMRVDSRIKAAADLDGTVGFDQDDGGPGLSPLAEKGLSKPFLLMGSQASDHHVVRSWEALWQHSTGWKRDLHLRGSKHHAYTDLASLVPQLHLTDPGAGDIGWIAKGHALAAQRTYLTAFFDHWLRGRTGWPTDPDVTSVS